MSDTPLLDELEQLGVAGADLEREILRSAKQIRLERRRRGRPDVRGFVAGYLAERPDATANEVHRSLQESHAGVRRTEVLAVIRELRATTRPVPGGGNQ